MRQPKHPQSRRNWGGSHNTVPDNSYGQRADLSTKMALSRVRMTTMNIDHKSHDYLASILARFSWAISSIFFNMKIQNSLSYSTFVEKCPVYAL